MRRWALRILIILAVVLVIVATSIQIVLGTDLPRKLVVSKLESTLAIRVGAKSVKTGWAGNTTLEDVTLSLPLAKDSFLKVKTLRVKHTALPALMFGKTLTVKMLEFDDPELLVQQDRSGQWNIVQAGQLVARAGGGKQAADTAQPQKPEVVQIPEVYLKNGTVRVIDRDGKEATIAPLDVSGKPESALVWHYEVNAGPTASRQVHIAGKLVPGGDWQHEVELTLHNEGAWLKPWIASEQVQAIVDQSVIFCDWQGNATPDGVSGLLQLKPVQSGPYKASGAIRIDVKNGVVSARPSNLQFEGVPGLTAGAQLRSGEIRMEGGAVQLVDLIASAAAGDVRLNGKYTLGEGGADLAADWVNLQLPAGYLQSGSMKFGLRTNWTGSLDVVTNLTSVGTSPAASWDTSLTLTGSGNTFQAIEWGLKADRLRVKKGTINANLDQLTARLTNTAEQLTLVELTIPAGQLTPDRPRGSLHGSGKYRYAAKNSPAGGDWYVNVWGEDWRVFEKRDITAKFNLDATGDLNANDKQNWARLNELYASSSNGVRFWAGGSLSYLAVGKPADLWVYAWYPPFALQGYTEETALQGGDFQSEMHLTGGAWPLALDVNGSVAGTNVLIGNHPVGDVSMKVRPDSRIEGNDSGDFTVHVATEHLKLFEGDWGLDARYVSKTGAATVDTKLEQMSVNALAQFANNPAPVGGTISGQWKVTLPNLTLKEAIVEGDLKVVNVRAPLFAADTITAHLSTNPRKIVLNKIRVLRNLGGEINAAMSFPVARPNELDVKVDVAAWPVQLPGASIIVYAQTTEAAEIDLNSKMTHAPFKLDLYPLIHGIDCGVIRTTGNMTGRVIALTEINGKCFGGQITGVASYDLDKLTNVRANLSWKDIDSTQVSAFWRPTPTTQPGPTIPATQPAELAGTIAGTAELGSPVGERPIAPLLLRITMKGEKLVWRATKIDGAVVNIFYDPTGEAGGERVIMDDTSVDAAGGKMKLFARLTRHPLSAATQPADVRAATQPTGEWAFDTLVEADGLDLNQLAHSGDKTAHDEPGRVQLHSTLLGNPFNRRTWVGDGTAVLTESDLAENAIIGGLYDIMSIRFGRKMPEGRGTASFHFEGDTLRIDNFFFTQRGIEARGNGMVRSVWTVPDSPIDGFIAGTLRPLRDLKLPFAADLDRVFSLLQRSLTVISINGTVRNPKVQQASFAEIGQGLKQFILGDLLGNGH